MTMRTVEGRGAAVGRLARGRTGLAVATLAGVFGLATTAAMAAPARIILLRHGEKQDAYRLCATGAERAQALAARYLGKSATQSLFRPGETPKAFFAVTLHTLETISPSAMSWAMPVTLYSSLPGGSAQALDDTIDVRTGQLVQNLLSDPIWNGSTVVITWEHDHIAKKEKAPAAGAAKARGDAPHDSGQTEGAHKDGGHKDGAKASGHRPEAPSTLYGLLGLKDVPGALASWPGATYDYFWIIDFDPATGQVTQFAKQKQVYDGPYANLPQNDWGAPNGLTAASGCALAHSG